MNIAGLEGAARSDVRTITTRPSDWHELLHGDTSTIEQVLPDHMKQQRWFGDKDRAITGAHVLDSIRMPMPGSRSYGARDAELAIVNVDFADGGSRLYSLPVTAHTMMPGRASEAIARVRTHRGAVVLSDGSSDEAFSRDFLRAMVHGTKLSGDRGELVGSPTSAVNDASRAASSITAYPLGAEQSNTSIVQGSVVSKLLRSLDPGTDPDIEISRHLTQHGYTGTPTTFGSAEYVQTDGTKIPIGIAQQLESVKGDSWSKSLADLDRFLSSRDLSEAPPQSTGSLFEQASAPASELAERTMPADLDYAARLGAITAEMHNTLGAESSDPAFTRRPLDTKELGDTMHQDVRAGFDAVRAVPTSPENQALLDLEGTAHDRADEVARIAPDDAGMASRVHSDYHHGQVIITDSGNPKVLDFGGEPARTIEERRAPRSPLSDVGGMVRSWDYAAETGARTFADRPGASAPAARSSRAWSAFWRDQMSSQFVRSYLKHVDGALLPKDPANQSKLLDAFVLDKATYELRYEAGNRPDWLSIPRGGTTRLLQN